MRILHVITRYLDGGSERDLNDLMRWQVDRGHDVHVALGRDSMPERVRSEVTVHPVPALVRRPLPAADARAVRHLRRLIADQRFDVVHTHQSKAGIVGRVAARGRVGALAHTIYMSSFGPAYSRAASWAYASAERYCAGFTDVILSVGAELRDDYLGARIGAPDQYLITRSRVDVQRYLAMRDRGADERAAVRGRFGVPAGQRALIGIGALEPRKRYALVIERLAPVLRRHDAVLLIAGDGPERPALEATIARLGIGDVVRLLGYVDDVPGLLASADVFVHAGRAEGVPRVLIEALAAGLPAVATEVVGLREIPGAPIAIVDADGRGLGAAVERTLLTPPAPLPPDHLLPWHDAEIDRAIDEAHRRLEARLLARSGAPALA